MKKNGFLMMTLAAFVVMTAVAPLHAAADCRKSGEPETKMTGKGCAMESGCMMLQRIPNLSEEQKGKLEKLRLDHQKAMIDARAEMEKQALEMRTLMKDPVDVKKVEARIDEMARMRASMQKKCLAHCLAVRALLTDEQKTKLDEAGGCGLMMCAPGCRMEGAGMKTQRGTDCMNRHGQKTGECPKKTAEEKK